MKKVFLLVCLFIVLGVGPLFAATAGSCTVSQTYIDNAQFIQVITWSCTTNSADGTVPSTFASAKVTGWVFNVDLTVSGSIPPTSSGAVTFIDSGSGNDVMGGTCTVGTTTSRCAPAKSGWVNGTLTPGFGSDNFGNSKAFTMKAWLWHQKTY